MSRRSLSERIALGLARFVAGPERRAWLDAMEAELDHLPARRLDWALGSLVAAVKDRAGRDWPFGLALGVLPGFAFVATIVVAGFSSLVLATAGLPVASAYVALALAPLPFAYALGRIRPAWPALWVGTTGFLAYQALPFVAWRVLFGDGWWFFWGTTLWPFGVPVPLVLPVWLLGAWWGARAGRRRTGRLPSR
jgi:hypothetical protein